MSDSRVDYKSLYQDFLAEENFQTLDSKWILSDAVTQGLISNNLSQEIKANTDPSERRNAFFLEHMPAQRAWGFQKLIEILKKNMHLEAAAWLEMRKSSINLSDGVDYRLWEALIKDKTVLEQITGRVNFFDLHADFYGSVFTQPLSFADKIKPKPEYATECMDTFKNTPASIETFLRALKKHNYGKQLSLDIAAVLDKASESDKYSKFVEAIY